MTQLLPSQLRWGTYKQYAGPFFPGSVPFRTPSNPTQSDIEIATITATEGGHYDALNMYDSCIATLGIVQWCEAGQFSVSEMIGHFVEATSHSIVLTELGPALEASDVSFGLNPRNKWRFFFNDARGEIDNRREQQQLFLLDSNGEQGSWTPQSKAHAQLWGARLVSLFSNPDTLAPQLKFTKERLVSWFLVDRAKELYASAPDNAVGNAFRAALLSFAANNPTWANKYLRYVDDDTNSPERFSIDWLIDVLQSLTFGPRVAIYPDRYNKIRPVLEEHYGINLPDFSDQLQSWQSVPTTEAPTATLEPKVIQGWLKKLGYDLGSSGPNKDGVDNRWGNKTKTALSEFQSMYGLVPADGHPGKATVETLGLVVSSLNNESFEKERLAGLNAHIIAEAVRRLNEETRLSTPED